MNEDINTEIDHIVNNLLDEGLFVFSKNGFYLTHPSLDKIPITQRDPERTVLTPSETLNFRLDLVGDKIIESTIERYKGHEEVETYLRRQLINFFNPALLIKMGPYRVHDIKYARQRELEIQKDLFENISEYSSGIFSLAEF